MSIIDELEELERGASEGPWVASGSMVERGDEEPVACAESDEDGAQRHANADFIAHARNTLPALLAVARAAEAVRAIEREQTKADFLVDDWARLEAAWNALDAALAALVEVGK